MTLCTENGKRRRNRLKKNSVSPFFLPLSSAVLNDTVTLPVSQKTHTYSCLVPLSPGQTLGGASETRGLVRHAGVCVLSCNTPTHQAS